MKNRSALGLVLLCVAACGKGDNDPPVSTDTTTNTTSAPTQTTATGAATTSGTPSTTSTATTTGPNGSSTTPTSTGASGTSSGGSGASTSPTTTGGSGASSNATSGSGGATSVAETSKGTPDDTSSGSTEWWFNGPRPAPTTGTWPPPAIKLTEVSAGTQPTSISAPRADKTRLYFTEKWGRIRVIKDGTLVEEPALDMRDWVLEGGPQGSQGPELVNQGKRGLVGLAFHPNYADNGRIFVMYVEDQGIPGYGTDNHNNLYDDGDITFAEYTRSATDPDKFDPESRKLILQFDKGNCDQCSQHNGGALEIGVDGFLWASTGDPPPYDNPGSQDLNNLNGKLLKFDISGTEVKAAGNYPGADPYVASIGIRNAYKFSIDRYTGDRWVADVGENSWEEITVETFAEGNQDHGWPKYEGLQSYMAPECEGCLDPIYDYGHQGEEGTPGADNCIVGGYVYRGEAIPELQGTYIYGDNGSGRIRGIQRKSDGTLVSAEPHVFTGLTVGMGCFGEDAAGEMYVCDYTNNKILRVDKQ